MFGANDFKVVEERKLTPSDQQFIVSEQYGFLPRNLPLWELPNQYSALDSLLKRAVINQPDGSKGLLAHGKFGDAVQKELPLYDMDKVTDSRLVSALLRDYSFLASMYLLEPCDISIRKNKVYGLARDVLPANIAVPFTKLAEKAGAYPFLEYSNGYVGTNWKLADPKKPMDPENILLLRQFEGGRDEFWFMAIHLSMAQHSAELVRVTRRLLKAAEAKDRANFIQGLKDLLAVNKKINYEMDRMWEQNRPAEYNNYRTFIMGSKNQPMFPNGILYEGVSKERKFYRGESGANDSIVPTLDNLLEVTAELPNNSLTEILKDFRQYRPKDHNDWLSWVETKARSVGIKKFAMEDPTSSVLMLANLDRIAEFRERHWRFTKEYIIKHSKHPVATGGSPITTWLPNQLSSVLKVIEEVSGGLKADKLSDEYKKLAIELGKRATTQRQILIREVNEMKKLFPGQDV
jgi:indoleamine 2,3-dioxygenase